MTDDKIKCGVMHYGYVCIEPKGHEGEHKAHEDPSTPGENLYVTWPNKEPTEAAPKMIKIRIDSDGELWLLRGTEYRVAGCPWWQRKNGTSQPCGDWCSLFPLNIDAPTLGEFIMIHLCHATHHCKPDEFEDLRP